MQTVIDIDIVVMYARGSVQRLEKDFGHEKYPFAGYLGNLLASIKLVAFAEINPVMVCGLNSTKS